MAQQTKKTSGSRSTSKGKAKVTTEVSYNKDRPKDSLLDEIAIILIALFAILMFISLVSKSMGIFGELISSFLKGLFGVGAYILPILIIGICVWYLAFKERQLAIIKIIGIILLILGVSSFFQYAFGGLNVQAGLSFFKLFGFFYKQPAGFGGGAIGGVIAFGLNKAFGAGTGIILIVLILISVLMITGKSFFTGVLRFFGFVSERRKKREAHIKAQAEYIRERDERRAKKQEERAVREEERLNKADKKKRFFDIELGGTEGQEGNVEVDTSDTSENTIPINMPSTKKKKDFIEAKLKPIEDETSYSSESIRVNEAMPIIKTKEPPKEEPKPTITKKEDKPKEEGESAEDIQKEVETTDEMPKEEYVFPPIDLLAKGSFVSGSDSKAQMLDNAKKLEETLKSFGVDAKVIQINKGPTVTRYELSPSQGVKVSKIVNLADDISLNLASSGIRIEAPIPGKAAVGIEVPNKETQAVSLREVIDSDTFKSHPSKIAFALGEDIAGNPVVADISKMPHMLIAGATGSGKSVCINTLITSILYKARPSEVKLLLVDPKVVELSVYNGIPHLLIPVVTDPKKAAGALNWAVREMLSRYQSFSETNVRDINGYNRLKADKGEADLMPQIVIIIDELADLMMAAPGDVEDSICRLAQMARAAGMHLVIATQRPSVDVITGIIKANIPSRLAFAVSSGIDSRTILDMVGAEKLIGKGDMLFYPMGKNKPERMQGAFISDKEVESIVQFIKGNKEIDYDSDMIDKITKSTKNASADEESDEFFEQAVDLVVEKEKASVSMLQRQFRIGYNRAARLMEELENKGIVGPEDGSKPRRVLITRSELIEMRNGKESDE